MKRSTTKTGEKMSNPVIVNISEGSWVKVATGIERCRVYIQDAEAQYYWTHRKTTEAAPTSFIEAVLLENGEDIRPIYSIDLYIWCRGGTGTVRIDAVSSLENMASQQWLIAVANEEVPGWSLERKFGSIDAIQADTPADVWEYGVTPGAELYTWSVGAVIDTMSSSDADDDELTTIEGLDVDGLPVTQTKALNGQNKVSITPLSRVNRVFNANGTVYEGNVYVYEDDTIDAGVPDTVTKVRGYVSSGNGQTLQTNYTIPANKVGFFMGLETSLTKGIGATAVGANLKGITREFGKTFRVQDEFNLLSSGSSLKTYNFPTPLRFQPRTDFCPLADVSANNVGVSWAFSMLLRDI
jgi:hypothetical protein